MGMLDGKVVAVTGAGRGVGREIALLCAAHGAAVIVNDPGVGGGGEGGDAGPAQDTVNDILAAGGKAHANMASVADPVGATSIIEDAVQRFGRIDAVVNNAGIFLPGSIEQEEVGVFEKVISVNLAASYHLSRACLPMLRRASKAHIFSIASILNSHQATCLIFGKIYPLVDGSKVISE